jgi:BMFP domain-containing protein YqiC
MLRCIPLRLALLAVLAGTLFSCAAISQSQDTQSVAEAARRAREKKKANTRPVKVITDETLDVKKGDVQSAVAEVPRMPGAPEAKDQSASGAANAAPSSATTQSGEEEKLKKEVAAAKEQLKQALGDLDLLQREYRLDNEAFYSKPDYSGDKAGKQKLDDEKQQINDKREEVERLRAKVADLEKSLGSSSSASSQP